MAIAAKLKQGEAKTLRFTVVDSSGTAVDCSTATVSFKMKIDKNVAAADLEKEDTDFDKASAAAGKLDLPLSTTDTDLSIGVYFGELKLSFEAANQDLSRDLKIEIKQAVF